MNNPVKNINDEYPPTLLLHGGRDTDVPYEKSVMMAKELSRYEVKNKLITITGGSHGFDRNDDDPVVQKSFSDVLDFLDLYLK